MVFWPMCKLYWLLVFECHLHINIRNRLDCLVLQLQQDCCQLEAKYGNRKAAPQVGELIPKQNTYTEESPNENNFCKSNIATVFDQTFD